MAAGGAAPLIAAESPGPVAPFIRAVAPEVVAESVQPTAAPGGPPRKGGRRVTSRSPSGAAHPENGVIAPFHDGRLRSRSVKGTRRPPFSAPPARRRPSETAIRTVSPALTPEALPAGRRKLGRKRPGADSEMGPADAGRARMCGIGPVEAVLHIRSGSAGGGSAESCGNSPAFNAAEILPCAESPCLHMGARSLKTDVPGRTAESCGKLGVGPRGSRPPMCNIPQSVVRPAGSASGTSCACGGRVRVVAALTSNNGTSCACGGSR